MQVLTRYWSRWLGVAALGATLVLGTAGTALADTKEDYERAFRAYQTGDVITAMSALRKPADAGHAPSQVLLAEILDRAEFNEEAVTYYRKAADQGDAAGEFGLASMLLAGEGVKKDLAQALFWFTRSAERDHTPAVIALAAAYANGTADIDGKAADPATALRWIRRAAERDHVPSMLALANAHREGRFGLSPDAKEAQAWTDKVAQLQKTDPKARRRR